MGLAALELFREADRFGQPALGQVAVSRAGAHMIVPAAAAAHRVQKDALETMVVADGPGSLGGYTRQVFAGQLKPARLEGSAVDHSAAPRAGTVGPVWCSPVTRSTAKPAVRPWTIVEAKMVKAIVAQS